MIGQVINGYKIIDSLGSGAFGHTYKVNKDKNIYAMKILKPDAMSNDIQSGGYPRFQREIRSLQCSGRKKLPTVSGLKRPTCFA